MENQDVNKHPKPQDDAQSLVETIVPSTEEKPSTTTKPDAGNGKAAAPSPEEKTEDVAKDDKADDRDSGEVEQEKPSGKGDDIETVAP